MFKRLSKARRHSADEVASVLPNHPVTLGEPPGSTKNSDLNHQNHHLLSPNGAAYLFNSRSKYSRKSCGDAYALLATANEEEEKNQDEETDYHVVTAVPAFIVEHESEKPRGWYNYFFNFYLGAVFFCVDYICHFVILLKFISGIMKVEGHFYYSEFVCFLQKICIEIFVLFCFCCFEMT